MRKLTFVAVFLAVCVAGLAAAAATGKAADGADSKGGHTAKRATAIFAGGCFWCMEPPYEKTPGVVDVISGYTGGHKKDPAYEEVSAGGTGHVEAVKVVYDPSKVSYEKLLDVFWRQVDPTDPGGQFVDRGTQYRPVIFYQGEEQKRLAEKSREQIARSGRFKKQIATEVAPASTFYNAEEYHQDYYKKNPVRYNFYRYRSGRDQFLDEVWGKQAGH